MNYYDPDFEEAHRQDEPAWWGYEGHLFDLLVDEGYYDEQED